MQVRLALSRADLALMQTQIVVENWKHLDTLSGRRKFEKAFPDPEDRNRLFKLYAKLKHEPHEIIVLPSDVILLTAAVHFMAVEL